MPPDFDRLPFELVQKIFLHYCSPIAVRFNLSRVCKNEEGTAQQATLSLVCSKWREIALNTGELWTEVDMLYDATIGKCETLEIGLEAVQRWLNRAGSLPINLYVQLDPVTNRLINRISQSLLSPYPIRDLFLCYGKSSLLTPTHVDVSRYPENLDDVFLPQLETLHIFEYDGPLETIVRQLILPKVKCLELSCHLISRIQLDPTVFEVISRRSGTGFNHLESLTIGLLKELIDVRALLQSMPSLKRIELRGPLLFTQRAFDDISICAIGRQLETVFFGVLADHQIDLLFKSIRERQKFAATELGISRLSIIRVLCIYRSDVDAHRERSRELSRELGTTVIVEKNYYNGTEKHITGHEGADDDSSFLDG